MVVVMSVSGELRGLASRGFFCLHFGGGEVFLRLECCGLGDVFAVDCWCRWSLAFLTVAVALSPVLRNCLEFPFQGLGCPLPCLWRGCVRGPRLFLARRRSFYWFSVGEYVRGCGGLRFGLSESSCLCGVVLETVKFWWWRSPLNLCLGTVYVFFLCRSSGCGSRFGYLLSK
ncbi:unnamed protein product [Brassica napus]|uniref:(rape) hypothetical protein n=1 Tax=Brassica napus TaxID=3708 RepID=A0A816KLM2_BRANA|nr:unnamed protein product [Brassica napus]